MISVLAKWLLCYIDSWGGLVSFDLCFLNNLLRSLEVNIDACP